METASLLPEILQWVGPIGVMTSLPQPQQHLCEAVEYLWEIYRTPSSRFAGIKLDKLRSERAPLHGIRSSFIVSFPAIEYTQKCSFSSLR